MVRGANPGGARFSAPVETGRGVHPVSYTGFRVIPGDKAARSWRRPHTPSGAEIKGRGRLLLYSPSGPSWLVLVPLCPLRLSDGRSQTDDLGEESNK